MAENGAVTGNLHFDTSRIGNEKMIRAEKQRAEVFQNLIDRVTSLEVVLELLLERSGISIRELVESNTGKPIEGEMIKVTGELAGDGSGEVLTPVNNSGGESFNPDNRRKIIEDEIIQDPVSI